MCLIEVVGLSQLRARMLNVVRKRIEKKKEKSTIL